MTFEQHVHACIGQDTGDKMTDRLHSVTFLNHYWEQFPKSVTSNHVLDC